MGAVPLVMGSEGGATGAGATGADAGGGATLGVMCSDPLPGFRGAAEPLKVGQAPGCDRNCEICGGGGY